MKITDTPDRKKWADFVLGHPSGNIFQTPELYDVFRATSDNHAEVIALVDDNGDIAGLMVYTILMEPGVKKFFSTRSIVTGGPLVKNDDLAIARQLFTAYCKKIKKAGAIYTEVRNLFDISALNQAFLDAGFSYVEHLTIHNDLQLSEDDMRKTLHRGRYSNIKRAINKNLVVRQITSKEEIMRGYEMIVDTYERVNLPAPHPDLFLNTADFLKEKAHLVGCFMDDKMIGCRVYLIYKDSMYDWYAAIDREYSKYQPSDITPWKMMLWGKEQGIKIYDFAGAGKPDKEYAVRTYKLKFGGKLLSFGRYMKVHKPLLFQVGKAGMKLYKYIR
ncbi:MAG: peptidoglycan bridge formation glycyltransferase FemA/FemB family protein [Flavobacteriales bacterium]|nr:peptidoglycan bridge formation glycyltransferase FemA/FemB family protein [Flavobacteriales bacterium]